jgi:hypothetical protein
MFELDDSGQLNPMTFKLNRDPHLSAGITAGYVGAATAHPARWAGGSDVRNDRLSLIRQADAPAPCCEILPV